MLVVKEKERIYESPKVKIVKIEVEKGFAGSGEPINTPYYPNEKTRFHYMINDVHDGGRAF